MSSENVSWKMFFESLDFIKQDSVEIESTRLTTVTKNIPANFPIGSSVLIIQDNCRILFNIRPFFTKEWFLVTVTCS